MNLPSIKRKFKVRFFLRGGQIATLYLKEFSCESRSNELVKTEWEGSPLALSYQRLDSIDRIEASSSWRFYLEWDK